MSLPFLSADDQPPVEMGQPDKLLQRQLEECVTKHFYEACDGVTQGLLLRCEWQITSMVDALTLEILCPDMMTNWRVLNNVVPLGNTLKQFVPSAKVRICPPAGTGTPFEVRVDEVSVHRDLL
ncbi:MAG: hypothetical protein NW220_21935 [Leptolyngbyaceae cyanobacterium bins.349]|nr:hypothetical protein [Leptolyngbyaceae cyanobacterium bins.349]